MWIAKWILVSIILNINAMDYVTQKAINRVNGLQGMKSIQEMYTGAITKNWYTLYPINIIKKKADLWIIPIVFIILMVIFTDWKNIKKMWFPALLLLVAITPYIRYFVLANHSYRHSMFTFRSQIITIIALGYAVIESLNYRLILKKINLKGYNKSNQRKEKTMKERKNTGITLIALVITIIVLLILAGVAISLTVNQGDLFNKANEAVQGWNESVAKEESQINNLIGQLNNMRRN